MYLVCNAFYIICFLKNKKHGTIKKWSVPNFKKSFVLEYIVLLFISIVPQGIQKYDIFQFFKIYVYNSKTASIVFTEKQKELQTGYKQFSIKPLAVLRYHKK